MTGGLYLKSNNPNLTGGEKRICICHVGREEEDEEDEEEVCT